MRTATFGIVGSGQFPEGMPDPGFFRELARLAEEAGFDHLWSTDHISFVNPILEGLVALSAFAGATTRIGLGTGIYLLPLRHPSAVAKQVASLDYVSGGRVILGIGVGGEGAKDFEAVQVPIGERGARADEAIAVLRALWRQPAASFAGRFFSFDGISIEPKPLQQGGPPIVVGGRSAAALRRAGALGDGWLAYMVSTEGFARDLATVRAHAAAAGRDPKAVWRGIVLPTYLHADPTRARAQVREHLSIRYGRAFDDQHVERYCLAGTPEEVGARIRAYLTAGVQHLVLIPAGPAKTTLEDVAGLARLVDPIRRNS